MNFPSLLALLSRTSSYPEPAQQIQVIHTHISVVFLTPRHAYKIKKPVDFGFLDFSTLDRRKHYCEEEVRLNRRLAPDVYLAVVPVTEEGVEKFGEPVEWAVKMLRLPDEATLQKSLVREELDVDTVINLAKRLASFHSGAARGPQIARFATFEAVATNVRDNFIEAQSTVDKTVHRGVFSRLRALSEEWLEDLEQLIDRRVAEGAPCDTHGDLHLDHIYYYPDRPPPTDFVIVDCIEFNERFRYADPLADAAFVAMDLKFHGRPDLARAFSAAYLDDNKWPDVGPLMRFYSAYRAVIRAKVEAIKAQELEVPPRERQTSLERSQAHWLLALAELESSHRFPCMVLIAGLPGSGKSTLARALCENGRFQCLQTDQIRKGLAGDLRGESIYTPHWNDLTYAECLRRAEDFLWQGHAVLIDANFRDEAKRLMFLRSAQRWGVPAVLLLCHADPEIARQRIAAREGDVSDANWQVRERVAALWEGVGPVCRRHMVELQTNATPQELLIQARSAIESLIH